jgi:rfaE bifunctional protein kinase chain/domain
MKVCVLGDILLDIYDMVFPKELSPEATMLICETDKTIYLPGGAAHTAFQCKRAGSQVELIGVCGDDLPGKKLIELLCKYKMPVNNIVVQSKSITLNKRRIVDQDGCQLIRIDTMNEGAWSETIDNIKKKIKQSSQNCDVLMVTDMGEGICDNDMAQMAVNAFKAKDKFVVVNGKPIHTNQYENADVVVMTIKEASDTINNYKLTPDDLAITLSKEINTSVLVTGGVKGMWYINDGIFSYVPACPIPHNILVDASGAGDILCSTIASVGKINSFVIEEAAKRVSANIQGNRLFNSMWDNL